MGGKTAYMQTYRAQRLLNGLCQRCGKNPPIKGRKTCGCDDVYLAQRRKDRIDNSQCVGCAADITEKSLYCELCQEKSRKLQRRKKAQRRKNGLCTSCGGATHEEGARICLRCRATSRNHKKRIKEEVFEVYGKTCKCCGEENPAFLTMDHIDGGGTAHRKSGASDIYKWLRSNRFPSGYQILCFNCNCGRSVNGGICPHQEIAK